MRILLETGETMIQIAPKSSNLIDVKNLIIASEKTDIDESSAKKIAFKIPGTPSHSPSHSPSHLLRSSPPPSLALPRFFSLSLFHHVHAFNII